MLELMRGRNHFKTAEQKLQDGFGRKECFSVIGLPWSFGSFFVFLDTSWMQEQEVESEMRIWLLPIINGPLSCTGESSSCCGREMYGRGKYKVELLLLVDSDRFALVRVCAVGNWGTSAIDMLVPCYFVCSKFVTENLN